MAFQTRALTCLDNLSRDIARQLRRHDKLSVSLSSGSDAMVHLKTMADVYTTVAFLVYHLHRHGNLGLNEYAEQIDSTDEPARVTERGEWVVKLVRELLDHMATVYRYVCENRLGEVIQMGAVLKHNLESQRQRRFGE